MQWNSFLPIATSWVHNAHTWLLLAMARNSYISGKLPNLGSSPYITQIMVGGGRKPERGGRQDGREESASSSEFHQFRSPRGREGGGVYESAHRKRLRGGSKKDGKSRLAWQSKSTSRRPILKRVLESAHDSFPFLRRGPDVKTEFVTVPAPTL